MRITSVIPHAASIPFKVPRTTAHEPMRHAAAVLVEVRTDQGVTGVGQIHGAPQKEIVQMANLFMLHKENDLTEREIGQRFHKKVGTPIYIGSHGLRTRAIAVEQGFQPFAGHTGPGGKAFDVTLGLPCVDGLAPGPVAVQATYNGESNANARYLAFAKQADKEGSMVTVTAACGVHRSGEEKGGLMEGQAVPGADPAPVPAICDNRDLRALLEEQHY